jgi:hypothetical protein
MTIVKGIAATTMIIAKRPNLRDREAGHFHEGFLSAVGCSSLISPTGIV